MAKKKLKFRKFYFFRRSEFIHFKVLKNENCFFLTVPMQETVITLVVSKTDMLQSV